MSTAPLIFDWDGDVRFYASPEDLALGIEPDDLLPGQLRNKLAFDAKGHQFIIADRDGSEDGALWVWKGRASIKLLQFTNVADEAKLNDLLNDWYPRYLKHVKKKTAEERRYSTTEILSVVEAKNLVAGRGRKQ